MLKHMLIDGKSIYFSALCRAVGIPARITGGWQIFSGNFSGHFWAEFYLPGYGGIPVDTTAAEPIIVNLALQQPASNCDTWRKCRT